MTTSTGLWSVQLKGVTDEERQHSNKVNREIHRFRWGRVLKRLNILCTWVQRSQIERITLF